MGLRGDSFRRVAPRLFATNLRFLRYNKDMKKRKPKSQVELFKRVARDRRLALEALIGKPRAKAIDTKKSIKQERKAHRAKKPKPEDE